MNPDKEVILLLDIDGVLVQPGGYRAALRATMQYFLDQMGLSDRFLPSEEEISILEAMGITAEFDMLPIMLATLVDRMLDLYGKRMQFDSIKMFLDWARSIQWDRLDFNYAPTFYEAGNYQGKGEPVVETIYKSYSTLNGCQLFPNISGDDLFHELFCNTRIIEKCWINRIFQNFCLGFDLFARLNPTLPVFSSPSYLEKYDQCQISTETRNYILEGCSKQRTHICIITARNCSPPKELDSLDISFTPEAEAALRVCGITGIPMIGYGSLKYQSVLLGVHPEKLLKPSPFQALAGIAAACSGNLTASLDWASEMFSIGNSNQLRTSLAFDLPKSIHIHIFEDSPIGIHSVREAVTILNKSKFEASYSSWGISIDNTKIQALRHVGAQVFPDINHAIRSAINIV
jgi:hypothetical protein